MCVCVKEKERGQGACSKPMYRPVSAHSSPSFFLFFSFKALLFLSVSIAQLVKAQRGVFFQAVLSSNPGQVKKLSFKDNCLDSEIFMAYHAGIEMETRGIVMENTGIEI